MYFAYIINARPGQYIRAAYSSLCVPHINFSFFLPQNFSSGVHFSRWGWIVYAVFYFGVYRSASKSSKRFQPWPLFFFNSSSKVHMSTENNNGS